MRSISLLLGSALLGALFQLQPASLAAEDYAFQAGPRLPVKTGAPAVAELADGGAVAAGGFVGPVGTPVSAVQRLNPTTGQWAAVATLGVARGYATATRLANGQVLIVGGTDGNGFGLAQVDRFDPATNVCQPAAPLSTGRFHHTATRLADGRLLVLGGTETQATALASGEIFDPQLGTWAATTPMPEARAAHNAVQLPDGRVLVVGGRATVGGPGLTTASYYLPNSDTWTPAPAPGQARAGAVATSLTDGRVLFAGASAEIFDPVSGQWTAVPAPSEYPIAAALLPSGRILVAGQLSAEVFDPVSATWALFSKLRMLRGNAFGATLLTDGRMLLVGGFIAYPPYDDLDSTEILAPRIGRWAPAASLNAARSAHTATVLADGRVLVAGGYGAAGRRSVEIYDPSTNVWTPTMPLLEARAGHTAVLLPSGEVLVAGGVGLSQATATAEIFHPGTQQWRPAGTLSEARTALASILLPNGNVLLCGGNSRAADLFVSSTGTFAPLPQMTTVRTAPALGLLPDGRVLIASGEANGPGLPDTSEIFDPATGQFTAAAPLNDRHSLPWGSVQSSGKLVVSGGSTPVTSTEVYDPATGVWTVVSRESGSADAFLTALSDGRLLSTGGTRPYDANAPAGERVLDPTTNRWIEAAPQSQSRVLHSAVPLRDGRILVIGGAGATSGDLDANSLAACELFIPSVQATQPVLGAVQATATNATLVWQAAGAGRPFRLEFADSLLGGWQRQPGTQYSDPTGRLEFVDASLPRPPARFYRAVQLP